MVQSKRVSRRRNSGKNIKSRRSKKKTSRRYRSVNGATSYVSKLRDAHSVAIVGPAPTLVGHALGTYIDSFDVVIRVNNSFDVAISNPDDYGTRCDILYSTLNEISKRKLCERTSREFLQSTMPHIVAVRPSCTTETVSAITCLLAVEKIKHHVDDRLLTGTRTCLDVQAFDNIENISVFGFSFYAPDIPTYATVTYNPVPCNVRHDMNVNRAYFCSFCKDVRVSLHHHTSSYAQCERLAQDQTPLRGNINT